MYSACKLNKQGDNIQPWCTPLPIWKQSVLPCPVLTIASWPTYRFLRRQVRWSGIPISLSIFHGLLWGRTELDMTEATQQQQQHTVKGFRIVSEAEVDVFLEFSCFFYDPTDVDNLISGSSTFAKFTLYIWKFLVHIPLKPSLENFEQYLLVCEMSAVVW